MSDYEACRDAGVHRDNVEADPTPKANLCSEIPCAEYRDKLECRVQDLEAKVREKNLQNDELKKLLVRVYAKHLPDVCDCDEPHDAPHSKECISTRVAEVSLQALTEKRNDHNCCYPHTPGLSCCCGCHTR